MLVFLALESSVGLILSGLIALGIFIFYARQLIKGEAKKFQNHLLNLGLSPDYVANIDASGIAIDREHRQIFAGNIKSGKLFNFDDIKGVDIEKIPHKNGQTDLVHRITLKTMDFDLPSVTVSLRPRDGTNTFEKLRIALDMS